MAGLPSYKTHAKVNAAFELQLESLLVKLKNVIIVGVPYRIFDARLACFSCGCMLSVYVDERPHCLRCDNVRWWSQDVKDRVAEIMRGYRESEGMKEGNAPKRQTKSGKGSSYSLCRSLL